LKGRVVLLVDSTDLLNRRHIDPVALDGAMLTPYPSPSLELGFGSVLRHDPPRPDPDQTDGGSRSGRDAQRAADVVVVTYGTGVMAARAAQRQLGDVDGLAVHVLEVPCVSALPAALAEALHASAPTAVIFADPCKAAQAPLLRFAADLNDLGILGRLCATTSDATHAAAAAHFAVDQSYDQRDSIKYREWAVVAATNTYNPLGSTVTFLSEGDIVKAARRLLGIPLAK
jgi:hypothetical protein